MKRILALLATLSAAFVIIPGQATPAEAITYTGDWRMTVHTMNPDQDFCFNDVCGTSIDVRTNQPGWEGSDMYLVQFSVDGGPLEYGDAGQSEYAEVDPDFGGVRATTIYGTLAPGAHTLTMKWFYRGYWMCGQSVPGGCGWVGRESVTKTWKFNWRGGADQTVWPYRTPASSVSVAATRSGAKVRVSGLVRAQRLNSNFVASQTLYPVAGAKATLQSYSRTRGVWVSRKTVYSNSRGRIAYTIRAPKALRWRWVVSAKAGSNGYKASTSRVITK